jgi:hypothetical protein
MNQRVGRRGNNSFVGLGYDCSLNMQHYDALAAILLCRCKMSLHLFELFCFLVAAHEAGLRSGQKCAVKQFIVFLSLMDILILTCVPLCSIFSF